MKKMMRHGIVKLKMKIYSEKKLMNNNKNKERYKLVKKNS